MFTFIILSILGYCFIITNYWRWPIETTPFFVTASIVSLLYLAGLINILQPAAYFIFEIGIISFAWSLILIRRNSKQLFSKFLTPGLMVFILLIILIWFKVRYGIFTTFDEFTYWGLVSKHIFIANNFSLINDIVAAKYPPGAALFHYFIFQPLGYSEGAAFFAQDILIIAPFIALLQNHNWRRWVIILATVIFGYLAIFTFGSWSHNPVSGGVGELLNLHLDIIVGVFFGVGLATYLLSKNRNAIIYQLIPVIFCMPILKNVGFFFASIIVIIIATEQIIRIYKKITEESKKNYRLELINSIKKNHHYFVAATCGIILLPAILIYSNLSWKYYTKSHESNQTTHGYNQIANFKNELLHGNFSETEKKIIAKYWLAIKTEKVGSAVIKLPFAKQKNISTTIWLALLLFLSLITFIVDKKPKDRFRIVYYNAWLMIGLLLYAITLLTQYLYLIGKYDANYLASFSRYMGTYFLSWAIIAFAFILNLLTPTKLISAQDKFLDPAAKPRDDKINYKFIMLMILPLICGFSAPSITWSFLLKSPFKLTGNKLFTDRLNLQQFVAHINNQIKLNKKIYIVWQNLPSFLFYVIHYEALPRYINSGAWSLGKPYNKIDFWTANLSPNNFLNYLKKYDYLLFIKTDKKFCMKYSGIFKINASNNKRCPHYGLYKIEKINYGRAQLLKENNFKL